MKSYSINPAILAGTSTTIAPGAPSVNFTAPSAGIAPGPIDPGVGTQPSQAPLTGEPVNTTSTDLAPLSGITSHGALADQSTPKHIEQASNSKPKG